MSVKHFTQLVMALLLTSLLAVNLTSASQEDSLPIKVFVLAGQSNMQGHGLLRTIDWLGEDEEYGHLLKTLKNEDGSWSVRDDVWIYYPRNPNTTKQGNLTVGFGANNNKIGPELMFGHIVGDHFENQVLLIKAAWGGKSLAEDFRPPSSGGTTGPYYNEMIKIVVDALSNIKEHFPDYQGQGYEIAGFIWFQGWNDMVDEKRVAEYEENLVNLIKDVRKDLKTPNLPFVVGELGVGGPEEAKKNKRIADIRKAQAAPANLEEFSGNVACVKTSKYWDNEAHQILKKYWIKRVWTDKDAQERFDKMGSQPPYHYLGSGKIYSLIGYGFAKAVIKLQNKTESKGNSN
ncbi:MAG: sialate O-acetylesterase [Planctomycetes bacterium]|nr:sialate O-acetylesterase [Planctomycetota bacterium]